SGQSSLAASRKLSPTGSVASQRRTTSALIGASARISSSTREASSPVLDSNGSCLRDALSASTFKGASDGILHRKRGLVLYMSTSWLIGAPRLTPVARSKWLHSTLLVPSQQPLARVFWTVTGALD